MSYIKSAKDIEVILESGAMLGVILDDLAAMVEPGISGKKIDDAAEQKILALGAKPAFKGHRVHKHGSPFPSTVCFSVNEEVVHGFASEEKILKEGDVVTIDIGMRYPKYGREYYTDTAVTVAVGDVDPKIAQIMSVSKKALKKGIDAALAGNSVAAIGRAVQEYVEPQGYGIVRDLCGHGVGHAVHEEPSVLNYYESYMERWKLESGVVIAIEPMITLGGWQVDTLDDEWTIVTRDRSIAVHDEHTIIVTEDGPVIATLRPSEQ